MFLNVPQDIILWQHCKRLAMNLGWLICWSLVCLVLLSPGASSSTLHHLPCRRVQGKDTVYQFTQPEIHQKRNISLKEYKGKILLIVNTATYSGLTWHYLEFNKLKDKYRKVGFEILGFPCTQFNKAEKGSNGTEIMNALKHVRPGKGYVPNFQMFFTVEVNGKDSVPLYQFLKNQCPPTRDYFIPRTMLSYTPFDIKDIRWNFEAFLIDRRGRPVTRYDPTAHPSTFSREIERVVKLSKEFQERDAKRQKEKIATSEFAENMNEGDRPNVSQLNRGERKKVDTSLPPSGNGDVSRDRPPRGEGGGGGIGGQPVLQESTPTEHQRLKDTLKEDDRAKELQKLGELPKKVPGEVDAARRGGNHEL